MATLERQFKLQQIETSLKKQPDTPATRTLKERLRVLEGLVMMENASKVPPSADEVYADLARSQTQLDLLQLRMAAVQQLLADNRKLAAIDNTARINTLATRLQDDYKALDKALDEYRTYLDQLARNQLDDNRNRINSDIAEAHLSIARLQDASLLHDDRQAARPEKPTP
jgi:hypothetical protein